MKLNESLKADLHIHTKYSMDCDTPLDRIINRCLEIGIDCIAIADHGTIEGALRLQDVAPFTVIVAEEILTPEGEIMGIFLKEGIPSGLSIAETMSRIKNQDALVCIPHPFSTLRGLSFDHRKLEEMAAQIDIMEVFNARSVLRRSSTQAQAFAHKHGLPGSAGSDAHTAGEIGNAYIKMPTFNGKGDFLQALARGKIFGSRTSLLVRFSGVWVRLKSGFHGKE